MSSSPHRKAPHAATGTVHSHRAPHLPHHREPVSSGRRLRGGSLTARFGGLQVSYMEHGPVHLKGTHAWGSHPDIFRLIILLDGEVTLRHADAVATLAPGDSALLLGTAPVVYSSQSPARTVTCDIPADEGALAALPRFAPFIVGRADTAVPRALGAYLLDLLRQHDRLTPLARTQTADILGTLATSTVMTLAGTDGGGWETRRQRMAAQRYIAARYTDPDLSSASVAEHLGLSRRSLQRLFESENRTVSQHIQQVRAHHAIARLKDPRLSTATLAEIATLSGFASTVAMRRAVVDTTGQTPTELRQAAANTSEGDPRAQEPPAGESQSVDVVP